MDSPAPSTQSRSSAVRGDWLRGVLRHRLALPVVLTLALVLRVAAVVAVGDPALEYEFATLTQNLLADRGYSYWSEMPDGSVVETFADDAARTFSSAYMPPAYPVFLWGLATVLGIGPTGVFIIELVQALMGAATVWLVFLLGQRLFDRDVGLLAALGVAVFPLMVVTAAQISAAGLTAFFLVLVLLALVRAADTGGIGAAVLAGAAFGLNMLTRAEFVLFLPFVALWFLLARTTRPWRTIALVAVTAAAVVAPWTVRNAIVMDKATPLTTSGGRNLWEAHGSMSVGTHSGFTSPRMAVPTALDSATSAVPVNPQFEVALDDVYKEFALKEISADPARVARMAVRKLWLLWGHFGGSDIDYPGAQSPAFWLPWLLVLPFFVVGVWSSLSYRDRRHWVLLFYLGMQTAVAMAFFVLPRYRAFLVPVVLIYASLGALALLARLTSSDNTSNAASGI